MLRHLCGINLLNTYVKRLTCTDGLTALLCGVPYSDRFNYVTVSMQKMFIAVQVRYPHLSVNTHQAIYSAHICVRRTLNWTSKLFCVPSRARCIYFFLPTYFARKAINNGFLPFVSCLTIPVCGHIKCICFIDNYSFFRIHGLLCLKITCKTLNYVQLIDIILLLKLQSF